MNAWRSEPLPVDAYLERIRGSLPAVDAALSRYSSMKLVDYVSVLARRRLPAYQSHQDFIDECVAYARETLGESTAAALGDDLARHPGVLTANHHGIDTFAQSTQSNLLFALRDGDADGFARTVPVLACGTIPLNNLTYPRGLLVYATGAAAAGELVRLPVFPDSHKRTLVSACPPFSGEMLDRSRARAQRAVAEQRIAGALQPALAQLFDGLADLAGAYPCYSRQATLANYRIWRLMFGDRAPRSELVYIELEKISARLLQKDLADPATVCHQLLFDRHMRELLLQNLDGQRACWNYEKLSRQCAGDGEATNGAAALGTLFFWGVDDRGRGFPLCLDDPGGRGRPALCGVDSRGRVWQCPFEPSAIAEALGDGRLLPSVFSSYLALAIARGIDCVGGYYQASYLPIMKHGVTAALAGRTVDSAALAEVPPDHYLSGMQTTVIRTDGQIRPAGPLEIIAGGGLDRERIRQISEISLGQAHIASLHDTLLDTEFRGADLARAKCDLAGVVHDALGTEIVVVAAP